MNLHTSVIMSMFVKRLIAIIECDQLFCLNFILLRIKNIILNKLKPLSQMLKT